MAAYLLDSCNGTYLRDEQAWRYPWGNPVPGARDLTLGDVMTIDGDAEGAAAIELFRPLTAAERRWLEGDASAISQVPLRSRNGHRPHIGDVIIGMHAPELHPMTMMTVGDIAAAAGITKATVDSYRYRGYLPEPQVVRGRTPLWARPIVRYWMATRPGPGARTDIYLEDREKLPTAMA